MATIITVHGTFASGPEEGTHWWQKGSEFEQEVRAWVEAEDGKLNFEPHAWDGRNSDTSRRAAGRTLFNQLRVLDDQGLCHCVVGHSHGGSVIGNALEYSASRRNRLNHLSKWITVGTPFIRVKKRALLFSRLGLMSKSAYVAVLTFCLVFLITLLSTTITAEYIEYIKIWTIEEISFAAIALGVVVAPFVLLHMGLWFVDFYRKPIYSAKRGHRTASLFLSRWLPLTDGQDEATDWLGALRGLHFPIFQKRFAVPALSALAVLAIPLAIWLPAILAFRLKPIEANFASGPIQYLLGIMTRPINYFTGFGPDADLLAVLILIFVVGPLLFILFGWLVVITAMMVSAWLSLLLSSTLNAATWTQIRQSAFGNDSDGQIAIDALRHPVWTTAQVPALPETLASELARFADEAASRSAPKLRQAVGELAFSLGDEEKSNTVSKYLTGDELIHTAYFKVPRFRKLVCYAIAQSPGFHPSEKFKSDPDYALVGTWHEQLQLEQSN